MRLVTGLAHVKLLMRGLISNATILTSFCPLDVRTVLLGNLFADVEWWQVRDDKT